MGNSPQPIQLDQSTFMPLDPASQPRQRSPVSASSSPASAPGPDYSHVQLDPSTFSPIGGNHLGAQESDTQQPGMGERIWKAGKEELGNLAGGAVAPVKAAVSPPEDATEHAISSIGGPGGLIAYRASKAVVDAVENMVKAKKESFKQAEMDVLHAVNEFHQKDYRNALADTGSVVADVGGMMGDPLATMGREREIVQGTKAGGDLATPLTKDVVDLGAAAALERVGGKLTKGPEAGGGTEATTTAKQAGPLRQILKGEKVAQEPAQQALRGGADAASGAPGAAAKTPSLRTVLEKPIDTIESNAKAAYRQVDEAAGTDFKALREKLENTEYQLRQLTETEEDVAKEASLEKSRTAIMDKIEAAKQQAIKAGVDPKLLDQADAQFKQASALKDLQTKVFKNTGIISGNKALGAEESVNVNQAVKELQKLQDNTKFGAARLEQALGKDGALAILKDMYAAQKAGIQAMSRQEFAIKLAKYTGWGSLLLGGAGAVRGALHAVTGE
jgi:hypothetical protein